MTLTSNRNISLIFNEIAETWVSCLAQIYEHVAVNVVKSGFDTFSVP